MRPCISVHPGAVIDTAPTSCSQRLCLESTTFFAVLQGARSEWRQSVTSFGFDFGDGLPELLDLRFADDSLLFARSAQDTAKLLDDLVRCCFGVGLRMKVTKSKIVTSQAQAPAQFCHPTRHTSGWVVCCPARVQKHILRMWTFFCRLLPGRLFANKEIFLDRNGCLKQRLEFFDALVTPVACFAAGHRAFFHADIRQFDVEFGTLQWRIVGLPADIQWDMLWHIILHHGNAKAMRDTGKVCAARPGDKFVCAILRAYWNFAAQDWWPRSVVRTGPKPFMQA